MSFNAVLKKSIQLFNLESDLDNYVEIHKSIKRDISFKGINLWILMFAIIIASVGLNVNSTAVIIGAMLISPLMGPINGIGYSLGTYNFELFRNSLKNFIFAIATALITSTVYFKLTPLSSAYSELLARTTPSIFDVIIALFGGLAGIIAISCKSKGNVIPGVAIATALMPPLCTAGYGLATWQLNFFFGAFYLFTINTVFIALASVLASRLLKFPIYGEVNVAHKTIVKRWISITIIIVLIPSIYFGYKLAEKENFETNAGYFVNNISDFEGNFLLRHEINADKKLIKLIFGGEVLSDQQKLAIKEKTKDFSLEDANIEFQQGLTLNNISDKNKILDTYRQQVSILSTSLINKEKQLDSIVNIKKTGQELLSEISTIFPEINFCSYSESEIYAIDGKNYAKKIVILAIEERNRLSDKEKLKIENWIYKRLKTNDVIVLFTNSEFRN